MLEGLLIGLSTAVSPTNLLLVVAGCLIGTLIGMLPGLGPMSIIAIMIPVAITIGDPTGALILLAGGLLRRDLRWFDIIDPAQRAGRLAGHVLGPRCFRRAIQRGAQPRSLRGRRLDHCGSICEFCPGGTDRRWSC